MILWRQLIAVIAGEKARIPVVCLLPAKNDEKSN
jgi:hypothetical protein